MEIKIDKIVITRGKKVNIGNYESENYEISMEVSLEKQDEPHETINGLKRVLDQKLESWEKSIKQTAVESDTNLKTEIKTADELFKQTSDIQTENYIADESNEHTNDNQKEIDAPIISLDDIPSPIEDSTFICPKCHEKMVQKEGKDYYLCSKHWGYPDMINRGEVREKQF